MNAETESGAFEPLPLKRRTLEQVDTNQYCVWFKSGEAKEIKANTAYEAFRGSGLGDIIKIERLFSTAKNVLAKSKFAEGGTGKAEEMDSAGSPKKSESLHERIRKNRNPIISPDELEELMQKARMQLAAEELQQKSHENALSAVASVQESTAHEGHGIDYVPPPVPSSDVPAFADPSNPTGLDVHGDGFDEIIPAPPPAKAPVLKSHEPKETAPVTAASEIAQPPQAPAAPGKELSADEVERLLSGK